MKYQTYNEEDKTTYLLDIDHEKKRFAVGSFKGKPKKKNLYIPIDITEYKDEINKIGVDYKCTENNLTI